LPAHFIQASKSVPDVCCIGWQLLFLSIYWLELHVATHSVFWHGGLQLLGLQASPDTAGVHVPEQYCGLVDGSHFGPVFITVFVTWLHAERLQLLGLQALAGVGVHVPPFLVITLHALYVTVQLYLAYAAPRNRDSVKRQAAKIFIIAFLFYQIIGKNKNNLMAPASYFLSRPNPLRRSGVFAAPPACRAGAARECARRNSVFVRNKRQTQSGQPSDPRPAEGPAADAYAVHRECVFFV
jgi:hypothetical protein